MMNCYYYGKDLIFFIFFISIALHINMSWKKKFDRLEKKFDKGQTLLCLDQTTLCFHLRPN